MIIKAIKQLVETQTSLLQKKANTYKVECAVDENLVDCEDFKESYTGVPAPDYLPEDPWFPSPVLSDKQMTIKEAHEQAVADNQILAEGDDGVVESSDIHQKMYEIATKGAPTTLQLDSPGGSENFQEGGHTGPGGWTSGTGIRQFH